MSNLLEFSKCNRVGFTRLYERSCRASGSEQDASQCNSMQDENIKWGYSGHNSCGAFNAGSRLICKQVGANPANKKDCCLGLKGQSGDINKDTGDCGAWCPNNYGECKDEVIEHCMVHANKPQIGINNMPYSQTQITKQNNFINNKTWVSNLNTNTICNQNEWSRIMTENCDKEDVFTPHGSKENCISNGLKWLPTICDKENNYTPTQIADKKEFLKDKKWIENANVMTICEPEHSDRIVTEYCDKKINYDKYATKRVCPPGGVFLEEQNITVGCTNEPITDINERKQLCKNKNMPEVQKFCIISKEIEQPDLEKTLSEIGDSMIRIN